MQLFCNFAIDWNLKNSNVYGPKRSSLLESREQILFYATKRLDRLHSGSQMPNTFDKEQKNQQALRLRLWGEAAHIYVFSSDGPQDVQARVDLDQSEPQRNTLV